MLGSTVLSPVSSVVDTVTFAGGSISVWDQRLICDAGGVLTGKRDRGCC
jgi:hypothetical protein